VGDFCDETRRELFLLRMKLVCIGRKRIEKGIHLKVIYCDSAIAKNLK